MKRQHALVPAALAAFVAAYVAFHPGVAYAEPRLVEPEQAIVTADYTIDTMHGGVFFEITHLGLSTVHGRFNTFSGKIHEDAMDLAKSTVEFTAKVASVDTAVPARDDHLRNADFFDVAKYPDLTFKSTKVNRTRGGYAVTGNLTIKGRTHSITIPFKHFGPSTLKGMGEQPSRMGIVAAPVKIKRSDYGVSDNAPLPDGTIGLSDEVVVRISLEGIREK